MQHTTFAVINFNPRKLVYKLNSIGNILFRLSIGFRSSQNNTKLKGWIKINIKLVVIFNGNNSKLIANVM